jgi:hypothetical protein
LEGILLNLQSWRDGVEEEREEQKEEEESYQMKGWYNQ